MRAEYLPFPFYCHLMCLLVRIPWVCLLAPDDEQGSQACGSISTGAKSAQNASKRNISRRVNRDHRESASHHSEFLWPQKQLPAQSFEAWRARRKWPKLQRPQLEHPPLPLSLLFFLYPTNHEPGGCGPSESDKPPTQNRPQNPTIAFMMLAGRLTQHGVCVIFERKTRGK